MVIFFPTSLLLTLCYLRFGLPDQSSGLLGDRGRHRLAGELFYCAKASGTDFKASAAFYTLFLVDDVNQVPSARNRLHRASPAANHTGLAFLGVYIKRGDLAE